MDELEMLKNTVESIRAVLIDAEDKQESQNHAVRNWVRMLKDVLLLADDLLDEFVIQDMRHKMDEEAHQNKVTKNLYGKRYLLVLDDVWNESHQKWEQLRPYLMCGAQGKESWSLLKKIAFGNDIIEVNQTIESIGKKIVEKCKGVPLAIRSLGGILQSKSEEREWIDVLRGDFWKLCDDKDSILPVLKLSYQNLSPQQRQCFAYCSLYPKGWVIEKDELVQMWMAQGYLECSVEEQCMEDVGNQFVNIFLMKSFLQDAKMNEDGGIKDFKMHDLMHDLATEVADNDCCYLD
ncbi:CC-NBS-LRR resistance protein, partial [Trifolium medium]|nr:CC-NBS-LRR resistance protein [Trifolium medium]